MEFCRTHTCVDRVNLQRYAVAMDVCDCVPYSLNHCEVHKKKGNFPMGKKMGGCDAMPLILGMGLCACSVLPLRLEDLNSTTDRDTQRQSGPGT